MEGEVPAQYVEGQSAVHTLTPEQANELAKQGATLLLLGVPAGTTIGIDFVSKSGRWAQSGIVRAVASLNQWPGVSGAGRPAAA